MNTFAFLVLAVCGSDQVVDKLKPGLQPTQVQQEPVAAELVQQALRFELDGDQPKRAAQLEAALRAAPEFAAANWHSRRVRIDDQWMAIGDAQQLARQSADLAEYRRRRSEVSGKVTREQQLARWCTHIGWTDSARLHYTRILLNPQANQSQRGEAMRNLGLTWVNGRLLTKTEIDEYQKEVRRREQAEKRWRPRLHRWQEAINGDSLRRRMLAIQTLGEVDDPSVISVADSRGYDQGNRFAGEIIALLKRFTEHEATLALMRWSVLSQWPDVRQTAIDALKKRSLHEFAPVLLHALTAPVHARFQLQTDFDGNIHYRQIYYQEGARHNTLLKKDQVAAVGRMKAIMVPTDRKGPQFGLPPAHWIRNRTRGGRSFNRRNSRQPEEIGFSRQLEFNARLHTEVVQRQIASSNAAAKVNNEPIYRVLEETTGAILPADPSSWWQWWREYNEVSGSTPTRYKYHYSEVALPKYYIPWRGQSIGFRAMSCFLAGTKVWSQTGRVPIESIRIGDRVLAQHPDTGELAYKLVLRTTIRPPSKLVKLTVNGEEIVTTLGHPFWVAGQGWRMAKRLKAGDQLHGVSGAIKLDAVERLPQPDRAYNLVVDDFSTYFVGEQAALVHDNIYREPTTALLPGLHGE